LLKLARTTLLAALLTACVTGLLATGYDDRTLIVHTFNLFNQKVPAGGLKVSWNGDWIFRRDRLEIVDRYFRIHRADIVLFQQSMQKALSEVEWDQSILSAGAFSEFDWRSEPVMEHADTSETESMVVAAASSMRMKQRQSGEAPSFWLVGPDGFLQATALESSGQPVAVFNLQMPSRIERDPIWFTFITERVREWSKALGICENRVIIGGYIPADVEARSFAEFLDELSLKDSANGMCDVALKCQTASPANEIFRLATADGVASQADRILVPRSAIVYSSIRTHDQPIDAPAYEKSMGFGQLWPSIRSGWEASIRLASCGR
jgi:hypothetical protein